MFVTEFGRSDRRKKKRVLGAKNSGQRERKSRRTRGDSGE